MVIGVCILAYGEEHIKECLKLLGQLKPYKLNFYITTNNPSAFQIHNVTTIHTTEPFNYNLKRLGFKSALENSDCVIMLDTDIYIKSGIDFSILENIEDGMYLRWQRVVSEDTKLSSEIEYLYIDKIKEVSNLNELFFIDESTLIFKISDNLTKLKIIECWGNLYNETKSIQPEYRYKGAVEGLIIYASVLSSDISVKYGMIEPIFQNIVHYKKYGKIDNKRLY